MSLYWLCWLDHFRLSESSHGFCVEKVKKLLRFVTFWNKERIKLCRVEIWVRYILCTMAQRPEMKFRNKNITYEEQKHKKLTFLIELLQRLNRINKRAAKFHFTASYSELWLEVQHFSSHDIDDNFNDNLDNNISDSLGNNLDDNVDENLGVVTTLTTTFWCQKNSINRYIEHWIRWIESWNNHFSTKAGPSKPSFNRLSRIKSKLMPVPSQGGAKLAADSPQCNMDSKVEVNKNKVQTNIS